MIELAEVELRVTIAYLAGLADGLRRAEHLLQQPPGQPQARLSHSHPASAEAQRRYLFSSSSGTPVDDGPSSPALA